MRPIKVWHTETVRIYWTLPNDREYVQDVTIPPNATIDARLALVHSIRRETSDADPRQSDR